MRLLLFSGGVDSTALAHWLRPELLLTVDYGQLPVEGEIAAARKIALDLSLRHEVLRIRGNDLGRGHLAGMMGEETEMAPEWWPYRNQFLVTVAAMRYEREGYREIILGTVTSDTVHCDGKKEFVEALDRLLSLQKPHVRVKAPAIDFSSEELIEISGVAYNTLGWAFSCHRSPIACGICSGCTKTVELFTKFGLL